MSNATNVETKHLKVGDVSYAYRELRPTNLADPTPVVFLHRSWEAKLATIRACGS